MVQEINLAGSWEFRLDPEKQGISQSWQGQDFPDRMSLPGTVQAARKAPFQDRMETHFLSDPHPFEGMAWFARNLDLTAADLAGTQALLCLERTRTSHVWVDGQYAGSLDSLCSTHRHNLTSLLKPGRQRLVVMVDNTACPVKGGHMTSQDTQTNWNGITGRLALEFRADCHVRDLQVYPDAGGHSLDIKAVLAGSRPALGTVRVLDPAGQILQTSSQHLEPGENRFHLPLAAGIKTWSEHQPVTYRLELSVSPAQAGPPCGRPDVVQAPFGLRNFRAQGSHFTINGQKTFLRGKHDGLIFPLTGHAPTDLDSWLKVMGMARQHGINHYRFHTACPPKAAFEAADILGIYLEPELPFWGTVTVEGEENHDPAGQAYLIQEGLRILDEFGNHPSFVMLSLGNELWGSKERLNQILGQYKAHDPRPLYTQGSNNFQFWPAIVENDDFFCGVRLSKERLFRGSYAMCDAPQGHIQTAAPTMSHDYDPLIRPDRTDGSQGEGGEITIQYGTGTKTVQAEASGEFIPRIPVVSHEVGQYCMYPDYGEIERYTGVLKPRNLEVFRQRLEAAGLGHKAQEFFEASGRFAVECYKAEIETALRSRELAGFQLLDIQDFSGQGTALVGILNALMESKGLISPQEWREFCDDQVLLAEFQSFVFSDATHELTIPLKLARYLPGALEHQWYEGSLSSRDAAGGREFNQSHSAPAKGPLDQGVFDIGHLELPVPRRDRPRRYDLDVKLSTAGVPQGKEIHNHYEWWYFPKDVPAAAAAQADYLETSRLPEALQALAEGRQVLFFPKNLPASRSIAGTYCTDFWNYPMFRAISESMKRPLPVGTLGLLIDKFHPALADFPCQGHSTPQWYDIVTASRALILDGTDIEPLVWTIDNVERNHRLGTIFEVTVGRGKALVCTSPLPDLEGSLPARWLAWSLRRYMAQGTMAPAAHLDAAGFKHLFSDE